jgi:16S rRNA (guanine1207-N2)-methyltransferase
MTEHYFTEKPTGSSKREVYNAIIKGQKFNIATYSGIFSLKELDFGSRMLIENAQVKGSVLDLGCGSGIIGIAIKKFNPSTDVWMCDINERAIRCAKENCVNNNVDCHVLKSDLFSNTELHNKYFDTILTNPPFSAGKSLCKEFIRQSSYHLNDSGLFQLVAPHKKGGESLKKFMLEIYGNVGELAKKSGYRIYLSVKR